MPKTRKMLGRVDAQECLSLMGLIETQNKMTLATWAIDYAKINYLDIYATQCPHDVRLNHTIAACENYVKGKMNLPEIKPLIKEAGQIARDLGHNPIAQAAARAIATACATIQTPTNALGFLFYGAAATAYHQVGLAEKADTYDQLATLELKKALASLRQMAVQDEQHPVKITWHC